MFVGISRLQGERSLGWNKQRNSPFWTTNIRDTPAIIIGAVEDRVGDALGWFVHSHNNARL